MQGYSSQLKLALREDGSVQTNLLVSWIDHSNKFGLFRKGLLD